MFWSKVEETFLKPYHTPNSKSVALNRQSDPIFRGFSHFKGSMTISNETINSFSPIFRELMEAFDANFKLKVIKCHTPPKAEILCVKNGRAIVVCGFLM